MRIVDPSVTLRYVTPNPAQDIEEAGRTCYKSEDKITDDSAEKFVGMICERGHVSVIEHAGASFRIVCDRGITHEIVRHRLASYSQESTRFCNYSKSRFGREIAVIAPHGIYPTNPDGSWEVWCKAMEQAERAYFALLDTGHKPQVARSVLPTCLKTEIVMSCNLREWTWFLEKRLPPAAHPDMRPVAYAIWKHLYEHCRPVFEPWKERALAVAEKFPGHPLIG
jgi:thymidylate synthase (FAD)